MISRVFRARLAVLPLACVAAFPCLAQSDNTLPETVVTATRIPEDPRSLAAGVTVIDARAIRALGATSVNEAIRWLAGVPGRTNTAVGSEQTLDLRGFGATAGSNVVVLVDGVRQNEGDFSGANLSWLSIDSVERIEVLRGSAAVLYGEGATGGVIHVITSKGLASPGGWVHVAVGANGERQARASVAGAAQALHWQVSAAAVNGDQHRDNFDRQERNGVARVTWEEGSTLLTARVGVLRSAGGLPGGLTPEEASVMPWQTFKPLDRGSEDTSNLLLGAEFNVAQWRVALDLTRRATDIGSDFVADGFASQVGVVSGRQGARAWRFYGVGPLSARTLVGADIERWDSSRDNQSSWGDSSTEVDQRSEAVYVRQELAAPDAAWRAFVGVRRTLAERSATGSQGGRIDPRNTSWEMGTTHAWPDSGQVFWRWGTSFRLPNVDEFSCYVGFENCTPGTVSLLKPQTSRDLELGWRDLDAAGSRSVRVYRSALRNEVGLDATNYNNVNYDPTRRQGVEIESLWHLGRSTDLSLALNLRSSRFSEGAYQGKTVPLVSARTLTVLWSHRLSGQQTLSLGAQAQSSQRIGGDLDNTCADDIAGFAVGRIRYAHSVGPWDWAFAVNNAFDRQYYNYRTRCDASLRSVYPEAGRTWMLSVERRF
ncbi:MAG: TonB-dependent receptor [Hydrogenophaga sp.]